MDPRARHTTTSARRMHAPPDSCVLSLTKRYTTYYDSRRQLYSLYSTLYSLSLSLPALAASARLTPRRWRRHSLLRACRSQTKS